MVKRISLILCLLLITSPLYAAQKVEVESLKISRAVAAATVTDSPTLLPTTALKGRKTLYVTNNSSLTIYVGPSDVTILTGTPILPQGRYIEDTTDNILLYGIAASGNNNVRIMEIR